MGALTALARLGNAAAGMPGLVYSGLGTAPTISDNNHCVFIASVAGPGVDAMNNDVLFSERGGSLGPLLQEHVTTVPETDPVITFFNSQNPGTSPVGGWAQNREGTAAFRIFVDAFFLPSNQHFGVYTDRSGPLTKYYRGGDTLAGSDPARVFHGCGDPLINDSGAMFTFRLDSVDFRGIWSDRARVGNIGAAGIGPLHAIATQNQAAPGAAFAFEAFGPLGFNRNGRVSFNGQSGLPVGPGGVWSDARFGVLQPIMLTGAPAPGVTNGSFSTLGVNIVTDLALADNNVTVVYANLQQSTTIGNSNDSGLWSTRTLSGPNPVGNLRLVVREGDPVPASAGPDFDSLNFGSVIAFWVNASGRVAFFVNHNDFTRALWIEQADGTLRPVVKEFTVFDVSGSGSDQRLISQIIVPGNNAATGDGRRSPFNDRGEIALRLQFADGSEGVFTTSPMQPAPPAECLADFNGDGSVDPDDLGDYINCYFSGSCGRADFNGDGSVNPDDLGDFINVYFGPHC